MLRQGGTTPDGLTLEDPAVLQYPGASDGAVKVVREGGGGVAYSWSAAEGKWEKIGQVVDEPGTMTGGGNMYQVRGAPPLSSKNSSKNS